MPPQLLEASRAAWELLPYAASTLLDSLDIQGGASVGEGGTGSGQANPQLFELRMCLSVLENATFTCLDNENEVLKLRVSYTGATVPVCLQPSGTKVVFISYRNVPCTSHGWPERKNCSQCVHFNIV